MTRRVALLGLLLSAGCGAPSDLEAGPVVLFCEGQEVTRAANGEVVREHKREFYRIDGAEHTLATWNDEAQGFGIGSPGLIVSATEARYTQENPILAGLASTKSVMFDRVRGRVQEEFAMSNGGTITFEAPCKPVKDPTRDQKF